jgi:hypothetical protein
MDGGSAENAGAVFRQYIGPYLKFINQFAVYLLIGGYGLLLAAVYIL